MKERAHRLTLLDRQMQPLPMYPEDCYRARTTASFRDQVEKHRQTHKHAYSIKEMGKRLDQQLGFTGRPPLPLPVLPALPSTRLSLDAPVDPVARVVLHTSPVSTQRLGLEETARE
jgi:hypothetical protein